MALDLNDSAQRMAYCLGINLGAGINRLPFKPNLDEFKKGFHCIFANATPEITQQQFQEFGQKLNEMLQDASGAKAEFDPETQKRYSQCLGIQVAFTFGDVSPELPEEAAMAGLTTVLNREKFLVSEETFKATMKEVQDLVNSSHGGCHCGHDCDGSCHGGHSPEEAAKNLAEGEAYMAENAKKDGVQTLQSGLQIEILAAGDAIRKPTADSSVKVHYRGTLINGQEFDSSYARNEPLTFSLSQVIPGWTEGLQHIGVGGKARLCIPSHLGYGESGAGGLIGPNATLLFEVELLDIL